MIDDGKMHSDMYICKRTSVPIKVVLLHTDGCQQGCRLKIVVRILRRKMATFSKPTNGSSEWGLVA